YTSDHHIISIDAGEVGGRIIDYSLYRAYLAERRVPLHVPEPAAPGLAKRQLFFEGELPTNPVDYTSSPHQYPIYQLEQDSSHRKVILKYVTPIPVKGHCRPLEARLVYELANAIQFK